MARGELDLPPSMLMSLTVLAGSARLAAAAAVVPEVAMTQGRLIDAWIDARLPAVLAATACSYSRRGIPGTIVAGTAAMPWLKLGGGG